MKKIFLVLGFVAGIAIYFFTRKKTGTSAGTGTGDSLLSGLNFPVYTSTTSSNSGGTGGGTVIDNGGSGGGGTTDPNALTNEVRELVYTVPAMLNQVDFSFINDFDVPLHPNPTYPNEPVFKCLLKGLNYRSQSTVGNIFKKGFTSLEWGLMINTTERQVYPDYYSNFVSPIPQEKRVIFISSGNTNLHSSASTSDINNTPYSAYNNLTGDLTNNICKMFDGSSNVAKIHLLGLDIENGIWGLPTADLANRLVAINEKLHEGCDPNTKISLLYQALPVVDVGFGVTYAKYSEPANAYWTTPASMTENAIAMGMPAGNVGKSLHSLAYIKCMFEYYLMYEAFQNEGAVLTNILDTPLLSGSGVNISVLTHFGVSNQDSPSYLHFAAHLASGLEINIPKLNGKKVMVQSNNFNIGGTGYFYRDFGNDWPSQPDTSKIKQCYDGFKYAIPARMMEAMALLTYFSGAEYYNWDASDVLTPVNRSLGEYVSNEVSRRDYVGIGGEQSAMRRLCAEKAQVGSTQKSVADLIDGTEIYTLDNTKVDYLNVSAFSGVRAVKGLDWRTYKLSAVRCIVNEAKGLIAILAFQPYGVEQSSVDVVYNSNGFNFRRNISIPVGHNKIYIYSLT
ncbi:MULTISPECIES: hypothetical protein [unclassified Arcicella]|uniref:hypothetical protein n=1 Tax=unclassified Arcicella TaxID=2644986 RepID=UPI0028650CCF|nr:MULTISPECIES: hypothetical protein [unclassified Arcicella]MDR6564970.1 hypothetical protein [Arcicella sp. BE51]MDR6814760.1 hypothetical protein [Arcicella sp. BE140]MDR6826206.1 hypothetical protein [Arcicella sp. BE139]